MTSHNPPKVQSLVEQHFIAAPRVTAYNQAYTLAHWYARLHQWRQPVLQAALNQRQAYFPPLPTAEFTQSNNLQAPQQPLLFVGQVSLTQQVIAPASRQPSQASAAENQSGETPSELFPLPSRDKTFYLAEHIEVATGELAFSSECFLFPGPLNFPWRCFYRSSIHQDFGLGPGWLHPLCERLWIKPGEAGHAQMMIHYLCSDGRYIQFVQPAIGEACVNRNEGIVLERLGSMNYRIIRRDQPDRIFRTDGANPWLPLVELRDAADNVLSIDYQDGLARKIVSSWGRVVEMVYQGRHITHIKGASADPDATPLAAYLYTEQGQLAALQDSQGRSEQYLYDNVRLKQRRLACGQQYTFHWCDEQHRYHRVQQGELSHQYSWRASLLKAEISNHLGHKSAAQFDKGHRLVEFTNAEGHRSRWFYDSYGNLCSYTNPLGQTTLYRWDKCGRCVRHTNAAGVSIYYRYDTSGNLVQVHNSAGQTWRREYNTCGQLVAEQDPAGNHWRYQYNSKYLLELLEDPEGGKTQWQWNSLAELEQVTSQEGRVTRLEYCQAGKLLGVKQAQQPLVSYGYDQHNRLVSARRLEGEYWKIKYDDNGRLMVIGVPNGFAAAYEYDDFGRCKGVKYKRGDQREYRYNEAGHCVQVLTHSGVETREYNRLGWLTAKQARGREQRFEYDATGNIIQHRDTAVIVQIERNAMGQPTKITNNSGEGNRYHYDELGRLTLAENRWGTLRFQYDLCNKLTAEHQELELTGSRSFNYRYDKRGWQLNTQSDAHHISYLLTPDGLLQGVNLEAEPIYRCNFDELGRETEWVHNALTTKITRQQHEVSKIETLAGSEQVKVFKQSFAGPRTSLLSHALGEQETLSPPLPPEQCDERGNLVEEGSYTFNYDGWNNLITAESGDFKTYYRYDAFARRIAKQTTHRKSKNVRQTVFCWQGTQLWNETHSGPKGEDHYHYLRHPEHQGLMAFLAKQKTYYYLNTPQLQPLALLSHQGETLWYAEYNEAGEYRGLVGQSKINNPWRSFAAYYDMETQLHFMVSTYYSPQLKAYLQRKHSE